MRAILATTALAALAAATVGVLAMPGRAADTAAQRVDNFELTDHTRLAHQLYYFGYAPAIVLMSRENGSAVSQASTEALQKVAAGYQDKGVLFYLLDSNLADSRDAVAAEAAKEKIGFPILMDELLRSERVRRGQLVCFLALGAGLNWGAALMRL